MWRGERGGQRERESWGIWGDRERERGGRQKENKRGSREEIEVAKGET